MFSLPRSVAFVVLLIAFTLGLSSLPVNNHLTAFHPADEIVALRNHAAMMMADTSEFFGTSSLCSNCHSFDPQGFASRDSLGNDVNVFDDWASSMMANSAKDPFWRAKVSHEVLVHPDKKIDIESACVTCHAPLGHYRAVLRGAEHYLIDDMLQDTFGLDGVSCGACHQQADIQLGDLHSGQLNFDTSRVIYGPYLFPYEQAMTLWVGFRPEYGEHLNDAGICASCHTLIVNPLDLDGNPTGTSFVEQATYHEWLNSSYNTTGVSCQKCHLPQIDEKIIIADNFGFLAGRSPFGLHEMVGGNTFMLKLMKENRQELGISATAGNYDSTIIATYKMLQQQTLDLGLTLENLTPDTAFFKLSLMNKAGHKFPSGYPSRRAFVEFVVVTENGDTLFQSGVLNDQNEVRGHDDHFEPHHQVINDPEQVQIYEMVQGDISGQFSTILEHGFAPLKDNRLPPLGFRMNHPVYDTTQIAGLALDDPDFNRTITGQEGSGRDLLYFHIPLEGFGGFINVFSKVYYQSLPPRWMAEMFAESTPEIETFRTMFDSADQSPVLIAADTLEGIFIEQVAVKDVEAGEGLAIFPNPTPNGWVNLQLPEGEELKLVEVFGINGSLVLRSDKLRIQLPEAAGVYYLRVRSKGGLEWRRAVVR